MATEHGAFADSLSHTMILLGSLGLLAILNYMGMLTIVSGALVSTLIVCHVYLLVANFRILRYYKVKREKERVQ